MSGPYWAIVVPRDGINLVTNPSFETGTAGWAGTAAVGVSLGTVSERQAFGAWSLQASGGGDLGATTSAALGSGTAYTASAYVRLLGGAGSVQINLGGTSHRTPISGTGWQRIAVGTTITATASYTLAVMRVGAADALYIDGVQLEAGSLTTYMDGDQEGCIWAGAAHASRSIRDADQRAGGTVYPLAALGFTPEETPGIGAAPTVNQMQPYAISDGAEYQRTRYEARPFTLTTTFIGSTYPGLHAVRRRALDVIKAGRTPTPAPARLLYWGGGGTVTIDALYQEGMDGAYANVVAEPAAVRFVAPDPSWEDELDQGTALAPYTALGSTNYIAYRDPLGRWGTMQTGGTSIQPNGGGGLIVSAIVANPGGTVYVSGDFRNPGGTAYRYVAQWANGAWGTLAGGTPVPYANDSVNDLVLNPGGTLFVIGPLSAGGTTVRGLAQWTGAWGSLINTGPAGSNGPTRNGNPSVFSAAIRGDGVLAFGGRFDAVAGTAAGSVGIWNGAGYGTFVGGGVDGGRVYRMRNLGGVLYAGGDFTSAGGTAASRVATYRNAGWGTLRSLLNNSVLAVGILPDYSALIGGAFSGASGTGITRLRGYQFAPAGSLTVATDYGIAAIHPLPDGGAWVAGSITAANGNQPITIGLVRWNGYSYAAADLITTGGVAAQRAVEAVTQDALGTLYVGGVFTGVGTAAAVTTVVSRAMGDSYPVLRLRHTGSGTARIYQLFNVTTGDEIYFNLTMIPGEQAVLDLRPESFGFTSSAQGTIISSILGGSNLSTWRVAPGTNTISFFADNAGVRADFFWRPRHISADGGAEPSI